MCSCWLLSSIALAAGVEGLLENNLRVRSREDAGAQAVVADPDRLGTLMVQLADVTAVCWLLGSAAGRMTCQKICSPDAPSDFAAPDWIEAGAESFVNDGDRFRDCSTATGDVAAGELIAETVASRYLGGTRRVWFYLPAGYANASASLSAPM